jgi:hypothetical protein
MKTLFITTVTVIAYMVATLPGAAQSTHTAGKPATGLTIPKKSGIITKGQPLSSNEIAHYQNRTLAVSTTAGGAEAGTGTIILAAIGAIVVVGAVIVAAQKNNENGE